MSRPKLGGRFLAELEAYYTKALVTTKKSSQRGKLRHLELHPSSFPYCGLRHMHDVCEAPPGGDRTQDFRMTVTVDVGTTFHTVIQQAMGTIVQIYGDWKCKCGNTTSFSNERLCGKCGKVMHYEELGIRVGKRICGHTDGLLRLAGTNKYIVIDYKTTRSSKILAHKLWQKRGRGRGAYEAFPDKHNVSQIRSYCGLIALQYDIEVVGWALIYAGRDSLATDYVICDGYTDAADMEDIQEELADWDDQCDMVVKASTMSDVKALVDCKPCSNHEDYMDRYHNKYQPCPVAGVCFQRKALKEHMEEQIYRARSWLPLTQVSLNKAHKDIEKSTGVKYTN